MGPGALKKIYDFDNYREFLKYRYTEAKAQDPKYSFRFFARNAGLSSPSSLKRVMDGERDLTADGVEKFAKALKLNGPEKDFFENLVKFNQATDTTEKQNLAKTLLRSRGYKQLHPLSEAQFNCLAFWFFLPIRELVNLPNFKEDPKWIAQKLTPSITEAEAKRALDELMKLGLLERNQEGRLVQTSNDITTGDEVVNSAIPIYHRELLGKAAESLANIPKEKRDISALTLGIPPEAVGKIKAMIQNFRKEVVGFLSNEGGSPETINQLNLQFFPVVKNKDEDLS